MGVDHLAKHLSSTSRIGLDAGLVTKLKIRSEDATRGALMAAREGKAGHLGVYFLAAHVVDDTDFFGKGEIYWWAIPLLGDREGQVYADPLCGLPTGAKPIKCGSGEWMKTPSLEQPALLAVIPPSEDVVACLLKLGLYDDDGVPADMPKAMNAALEALADLKGAPQKDPEAIFGPVRAALWAALKAQQDDKLQERELRLLRNEANCSAGMIESLPSSHASVYVLVKDEEHTEQLGPISLAKGQTETLKFKQPLRHGGRLALFARGGEVQTANFGNLTTETPFANKIIDAAGEAGLKDGFRVDAMANVDLVAYYTPRLGSMRPSGG